MVYHFQLKRLSTEIYFLSYLGWNFTYFCLQILSCFLFGHEIFSHFITIRTDREKEGSDNQIYKKKNNFFTHGKLRCFTSRDCCADIRFRQKQTIIVTGNQGISVCVCVFFFWGGESWAKRCLDNEWLQKIFITSICCREK